MTMIIDYTNNTEQICIEVDKVARQRMNDAVYFIRNIVKEKLSGVRHGRLYRVPGTRRFYTASSPGEPPALRLGDLRRSVNSKVESSDAQINGYVGTDLEYGSMLELGTKNIVVRPWLRPAFEESEDQVIKILGEPWLDD